MHLCTRESERHWTHVVFLVGSVLLLNFTINFSVSIINVTFKKMSSVRKTMWKIKAAKSHVGFIRIISNSWESITTTRITRISIDIVSNNLQIVTIDPRVSESNCDSCDLRLFEQFLSSTLFNYLSVLMNYTIINKIWKYFNSIEFYLEKKIRIISKWNKNRWNETNLSAKKPRAGDPPKSKICFSAMKFLPGTSLN